MDFFSRHMGAWVGWLLAALCLAPFLFGSLYFRPAAWSR